MDLCEVFFFFFYFNLKEFNISYYLEKCFFPHLVSNYSQSKDTCEKIVKPSSISICVTFLNINFKFVKGYKFQFPNNTKTISSD